LYTRSATLSWMTDSPTRSPGKRERLIEGARELIHEQGVHPTTLAEIAVRADVPLGNVYYYFRTKDDLVSAVTDDYVDQIRALLARLDRQRTPRARLKSLTRNWGDSASMVARSGCPLGSLSCELAKGDGDVAGAGRVIFGLLSSWIEAQFREMG